MELLSHLNTLDMVPDGDIRKIPTIATTSVAGTVKPDGTSILIDENGEIKANYNMVMKTATFDPVTAEFISTDCTWTDVITAATEGYELTIMGSMGDSTLWFQPEALSLISGYEYAQFAGRSVIFGYLVTMTITVPQTGVPYCTTIYSEKISEKVTSWSQTVNDTNYPSEKLVKDSLDAKAAASDLSTEVSTRSSQIQELDERVARLEGSVQYYLLKLNEEAYINPSTLQPVSGRTYTDSDFANDLLADINLKAWLEYNYELHDIVDLNTAAVKVVGFTDGEEGLWEFWSNITNPSISSYPLLQQVGQYINSGSGDIADFTNTVHGAIVGSAQDGYVTSAGGGKGQVYGWSTLKSRVKAVEDLNRFPSNSTPLVDVQGGAVGTSVEYARGDHQHPTDSTREAVAYKVSAWTETPNDNNYPTEKLVYDSINSEKNARIAGDNALGNRATALETFNTTTLPSTYATIANLNTTNANVAANTNSITAVSGRVTTNEEEIDDIWAALEASIDPDNPTSVTSQVANILNGSPEDFNTFLKVYNEFTEQQGEITTLKEDVNEAATVKSYNYSSATPTTYIIKVQSGTGSLPSDTNQLTFCY